MIVTIIMILTDWLMVGFTKLVYSCKVAYRQGMLFGVHVPGDVAELPEVKTMIEKYQSWMKAFYRWHFAIGTVICFLGMWYMSIFVIAWTVWMTAFFIGVMAKSGRHIRHMYETIESWSICTPMRTYRSAQCELDEEKCALAFPFVEGESLETRISRHGKEKRFCIAEKGL